ncbi:MAG: hypothetical protein CMB53_00095 [Euryarchaeota archaeon]|nr:hypothetical protein [Euryarchaeota archaeon]|tara:strand:- start:15591 stop:16499 length:909 start_codon:yes stop_codon:yes gene_type:complete
MRELGFNPVRIDKGDSVSVIIGSMGEIIRVDSEGVAVGNFSVPFPSQPTFGAICSGKWVGAWADRGFKKACMGAIPLNSELGFGRGRDFLRTNESSASEVLPDSCLWTRDIEGEPMGLASKEGNIIFGVLNTGIYKISGDATEIWRSPYPQWPELQDFSNVDSIIDIVHTPDGIAIWSESGGISLISDESGAALGSEVLKLPERVIGVRFDETNGWMIMMSGRYAATMKEMGSEPSIIKLPGPMMDCVVTEDGNWKWTGWRHDGILEDGTARIQERDDIGVSIIGDSVLTNSGRWSCHAFTE